jgi:hypothetical protein
LSDSKFSHDLLVRNPLIMLEPLTRLFGAFSPAAEIGSSSIGAFAMARETWSSKVSSMPIASGTLIRS